MGENILGVVIGGNQARHKSVKNGKGAWNSSRPLISGTIAAGQTLNGLFFQHISGLQISPHLLSFSRQTFCINFGLKIEEEAHNWAFFVDI